MQTHYKNRLSSDETSESHRLTQLKTLMPTLPNYVQKDYYFNSSLSLFDFYKRNKQSQTTNLFSDYELPKEA